MYPAHSRTRADFPLSLATINRRRLCTKRERCSGEANPRAERGRSRAPGNVRCFSEKVSVVQHQLSSGVIGGWFGGAGWECPPRIAKSRGESAGGPFPADRMAKRIRPMRLVHHHDDPTSTADRLVPDDLLHFEALKEEPKRRLE